MPLFFLISGYFLSIQRPWKFFLQKKINGLLIPYAVTGITIVILSAPINLMLHYPVVDGIYQWLMGVLYGNGTSRPSVFPSIPTFIGALWFLLALFWASLFTRFVLQYCPRWLRIIVLLCLFCLGWSTSTYAWWPWDIQAGMTTALLLYVGYEARAHNIINRKISNRSIALIVLFIIFSMFFYRGFSIARNHFGDGLLDFLRATLITWLIILFARHIKDSHVAKIMAWFGANSIIVLAFHIIELDLIPWHNMIRYALLIGIPNILTYVFIIIMKISWACFGIYFVHRSKILQKIYLRR